jgi:hypothetical protein
VKRATRPKGEANRRKEIGNGLINFHETAKECICRDWGRGESENASRNGEAGGGVGKID